MNRASSGDRVTLRSSQELASGGEGVVYLLPEYPDLVAKIYHSPAPGIDVKLGLMIDNPPRIPPDEEGRVSIAWPEDSLLDPATGGVTGFLMRRVSGRPIIEYFNPRLRPRTAPHFTYEHLLVAARNLAEAVDIFHGQRSVIGDLNESNVLVSEDASVALIDTDSFQVLDRRSGKPHRSPVGKPEYTPAELQGHRFDVEDRKNDHDLFGLAVIIYQLLMEGTHPFLGKYTGSGDPPQLEKRIKEGYFPHSRIRSVPFEPSPISPPWDTLHPALLGEFIQCFDRGHDNPHTRPTAHEWVQTLEEARESLVSCSVNGRHSYFNHLSDCPWCDRARRMGGRDSFSRPPPGVSSVPPASPLPRPTVAAPDPAPPAPRPAPAPMPSTSSVSTPAPGSGPTNPGETVVAVIIAVIGYVALIPLLFFTEWWITLVLMPVAAFFLYTAGAILFQRPISRIRWILIGLGAFVGASFSGAIIGEAQVNASWRMWLPTGLGMAFIFLVPAIEPLGELLRGPSVRRRRIAIVVLCLVALFILGNLIAAGIRDFQDVDIGIFGAATNTSGSTGGVDTPASGNTANSAAVGGVAPPIAPKDTPMPTPESAPPPAPIAAVAVSTSTPTPSPTSTPEPTFTPTPTFTPNPTLTPTPTPTPTYTPTPTHTPVPRIRRSEEVSLDEGSERIFPFDWDHALYGDGIPLITYKGSVNIWHSYVSHLDYQATITIGADDDSFVGNGNAEIQIANELGSVVYVLNVTVIDAGEPTATPTPTDTPTVTPTPPPTKTPTPTPVPTVTPTPTITPTVTPTPTPSATPTITPAPLPNLVLEIFDICVERTSCWREVEGQSEISGSRRVRVTWRVANRGSGPTQSPTDLRMYADGQRHEEEFIPEATFDIPILAAGEYVEAVAATRKNPGALREISFHLIGDSAIIAIVDMEDRVQEAGDNCGNLRGYRDRFSARDSECDNVKHIDNLRFLPTPVPTPTPLPTPTPTPDN